MGEDQATVVDGQEVKGRVFLIDKPAGMSSFAIVRRIRQLLGIKKVGHAGTLDPFATGLLIVCVGRAATRQIDRFMHGRKTYRATLQLGVETETQDPEGRVVRTSPIPPLDQATIDQCLHAHLGPQMQAPPPFSAAKHKGKPLYAYARKGVVIIKEPKPIEIYTLVCVGHDPVGSRLEIEVCCGPGTYVRVLAADIGRALGCGAHLVSLRRSACGIFAVADSLAGEVLFADSGRQALLDHALDLEEALLRVASTLPLCAGAA